MIVEQVLNVQLKFKLFRHTLQSTPVRQRLRGVVDYS